MTSSKVRKSAVHMVAFSLLMLFTSVAAALDGLSAGITAGSSGSGQTGLNARVAYPFLDLGSAEEPVQLAVRADLGFSLSRMTVPALGAALVLMVDPPGRLGAYLGGGVGVSFDTEAPNVFASGYVFTGIKVQLTDGLHAVLEGGANLNGYGTFTSLGLGLEYTFGGRE